MASWIRSYFRYTWKMLCAGACLLGIFHLVLALSVPLRPIWMEVAYLDLLLLSLGAAFYGFGFMHYRSRYRQIIQRLSTEEALGTVMDGSRGEDVRILAKCLRHDALLYEAREAALNANLQDQRDALTRWAHDVKTPLSVCALILERPEAEPVRAPLTRELSRIRGQVNHVLHVERLSHLHESLRLASLHVPALFRAAVLRAAPLLQARGLEVEIEAPPVEAMGDEQAVAYILDQLLSNAAKYASEKSVVTLGARREWGAAVLSVANEGPAIPAQDIRRVFDKGFSGEQGRESAASSGMGLFYTKKTAEALGGEMAVQSLEGSTVFMLKLPFYSEYLKPGREKM